jgi:hypothetical protein
VDNPMNRKLGRVGKVVGSAPVSTMSRIKGPADEELFRQLLENANNSSYHDNVFQPLITRIDPEVDYNLFQVFYILFVKDA